ncbi:MAG: hypothetical protein AAB152_05825 [Candidatus Coatesbacteria bacterium]
MPILLAVWAALVILLYAGSPQHLVPPGDLLAYVVPRHGTWDFDVLVAGWLSRAGAAAAWAGLNVALLGFGSAARRWLGGRPGWIRTWLLGFAPVALLALGLGLCSLFSRVPFVLVATASVALLLRCPPGRPRPLAGWVLAVAPCLLALPGALAPEIVFDALRYHLALPDAYLQAHKVFHMERFLFGTYPQGMEMLYGIALAFGTTVTAKLLAWECFALSTIQLWSRLAPLLPRAQAWCLTAAFAAMPFLSSHAGTAGVDHPLICLELAGFLVVLDQLDRPRRRDWLLAGWLFGTALGVKYLAALGIGGMVAGLLVCAPRLLLPAAAAGLPVAGFLAAAWGAKAWLTTGNPVYPYFFGHWQLEPETFRLHLAWVPEWRAAHPLWSSWASLVPVSLTRGIYDGLGEALSPALFLIVGGVAAAAKPLPRPARLLLAACAAMWIAWLWSAGGIYRYLAPLYPAAVLLAGALVPLLRVPPQAVTWTLAACVAVQAVPLIGADAKAFGSSSLLAGHESERGYLLRILPPGGRYLPAIERASAVAAPGRLLVLGDPKAFGASGQVRWEFELAPSVLFALAADCPSAARVRIGLRQRGITAILYSVGGMISMVRMSGAALSGPALGRLQNFWRDWAEPVWVDEHPAENCFYQGFRLRTRAGPFVRPVSALWYTVPGTEPVTNPIDQHLDANRLDAAFAVALDLADREPWFAPAWYRVWLAARLAPSPDWEQMAAARVRALGFSALLQ